MDQPLVTVLIVTWNRKDDVLESVRSVYEQAYGNVEIVVVDNGSTDGTVQALRGAYPCVKLVALERNEGPCAGRNAGVVACRGEIVFFLDSDASPRHDTLVSVVGKFRNEAQVGVIACKIVNAHTGEVGCGGGWAFSEKDKADQDCEFPSFSFSEGGCAIRRRVFDQVGLFCEPLFFGREGEELSLRVWDSGWKIVYWPTAVVYHRVSPQESVSPDERLYYELRNSLYIYLLRYPWWMLALFVPVRLGISLVKGWRRNWLRQIARAVRDVMWQLPTLWKHRQPISNATARLYLKLQRQHGPLRWDLVSWLKYKA